MIDKRYLKRITRAINHSKKHKDPKVIDLKMENKLTFSLILKNNQKFLRNNNKDNKDNKDDVDILSENLSYFYFDNIKRIYIDYQNSYSIFRMVFFPVFLKKLMPDLYESNKNKDKNIDYKVKENKRFNKYLRILLGWMSEWTLVSSIKDVKEERNEIIEFQNSLDY